jgi:hypothetical protein
MKQLSPAKVKRGRKLVAELSRICRNEPSFKSTLTRKYTVIATTTVTIPAGAYLFHGTVEPFSGGLKPGIDKIIWFSDSPKIAQLYIPKSGLTMYVDPHDIARPSKDKTDQKLQRELGIDYDYSQVEWDGQRLKSFPLPKGWEKIPTDTEVEKLMQERGLTEKRGSSFEIKMHGDKILKSDEVAQGRLFIAKVKEPLTILKKAKGEGDLMNPQHLDFAGFKGAKEKGEVDGVLIDDFAQSKEYGNFGHLSVGLFDTKKLEIKSIPAQYREWEYKSKGTPEYPNAPASFLHDLTS